MFYYNCKKNYVHVAVTTDGQNVLSYIRDKAPFWKPADESVCAKGKQQTK